MCLGTLQHTEKHCNARQRTATHCNARQHTATHGNTLQHMATHASWENRKYLLQPTRNRKAQQGSICDCNTAAKHCNTLQHNSAHCKALRHTATCCNTLQHTAAHASRENVCGKPTRDRKGQQVFINNCNALQHTASHCNILQDTPTQCKTPQHNAAHVFWENVHGKPSCAKLKR